MDIHNPVVQLCIQGTQAEYEGRTEEAWGLYRQAWERATDDYEACIAAHYVARSCSDPADILYWNQQALEHAGRVGDDRVIEFYPSLYLNMGRAYELMGKVAKAQRYYAQAERLGYAHSATDSL